MDDAKNPSADGAAPGSEKVRTEWIATTNGIGSAPQPFFLIKLRPTRGDGIRELRQSLKVLLRRFGMRCISIEQVPASALEDKRWLDAQWRGQQP